MHPLDIRRTLVALVLASLAAGCGGDEGLGPRDVRGIYTLVSVNGNALPFSSPATDAAGGTVRVDRGQLELQATEVFVGVAYGVRTYANGNATTWLHSFDGFFHIRDERSIDFAVYGAGGATSNMPAARRGDTLTMTIPNSSVTYSFVLDR